MPAFDLRQAQVSTPRWPHYLLASERWRIFCPTYQRKKNAHVSKAAWDHAVALF